MTTTHTLSANLPRPPQLLPGRPDAVVDLQTDEGAALVGARWRYGDARVEEVDFVEVGSAADPLGPGDVPNRTYEVLPHAEVVDFDDSGWRVLAPAETERAAEHRQGVLQLVPDDGDGAAAGRRPRPGRLRLSCSRSWSTTTPRCGSTAGCPRPSATAAARSSVGFNAPNRVVLTTEAQPGQTFQIAVFGINGPISAAPRNYIWLRGRDAGFLRGRDTPSPSRRPTYEIVRRRGWHRRAGRARHARSSASPAGSSSPRGRSGRATAPCCSAPRTRTRSTGWCPAVRLTVFRSHSGYTGVDIGRYHQPGSNGLTFDPQGRLTMCQHGNRRVVRVEPHGDVTVLADRYEGKRLNSPNDLVYRSDGALYFTDPPFGLPEVFDDPKKELRLQRGLHGPRRGGVTRRRLAGWAQRARLLA